MAAILSGTRGQVLTLAGIPDVTYRSLLMRGHVRGAFGVLEPKCWLAADAVALAIRDQLVRDGMPMALALPTVMSLWPEWVTALSRTEYGSPHLFVTAQYGERDWWSAPVPEGELAAGLKYLPTPRRMYVVDFAKMLAEIGERASKAGLDLSAGHFIMPPDDPMLTEWMQRQRDRRKTSMQRFDPLRVPKPIIVPRHLLEAAAMPIVSH